MLWFIVAVLFGIAPMDTKEITTVAGPFMSHQSCLEIAQEQLRIASEHPEKIGKGRLLSFACIPIRPDKRIVM